MKFGKLQDISKVDFSLPPDPMNTQKHLASLTPSTSIYLYVGCTGWHMKEWHGTVYPKKVKAKEYLKYYSEQFNTIELNTTHYRIPTAATIQKWYAESEKDFRFCPKIPKTISHSSQMGLNDGLLNMFCQSIEGLEEKLGPCFIQFPPYFEAKQLKKLTYFLEQFPQSIPLAVELRHESWFSNEEVSSAVANILAKKNQLFLITDVAGRRDVLHQQLSTNKVMVRFVGNDLVPSDYSRLDEWVQKLKLWYAEGIEEVYFFTHEPDNIQAPEIAKYFVEKAKAAIPSLNIRGPKFREEEGQQLSLF